MEDLGALNQGRRKQLSSAIFSKKFLSFNVLLVIITAQINGLISDKGWGGSPPHPRCDWGPKNAKLSKNLDVGKTATIIFHDRIKTNLIKVNFKKWFSKTFPETFGDGSILGWVDVVSVSSLWFGGVELRWNKDKQLSGFLTEIKSNLNLSMVWLAGGVSWAVRAGLHVGLGIPPMINKGNRDIKTNRQVPCKDTQKKSKLDQSTERKENRKPNSESESENDGDLFYDHNGGSERESESERKSAIMVFIVITKIMISLTIYLMLLQQTVESNPGPEIASKMSVLTYNTNGLRDKQKLKRLLLKIKPLVENGGIALLQETHVVDTEYIKFIWKNKFSSNCVSTNSAGVIILYNNEYELKEEYADQEGRQLIISIKKEDKKFIVVNAYYPNDHKVSLRFANDLYEQMIKMQQNYPEFEIIYSGDLNTCLTVKDCLNRNRSKTEEILSTLIRENNKVIGVEDAYRSIKPEDGYTWKRGNCCSRLDYIFLSKSLITKITKVKLDWAYESSDHAALEIEMKIEANPKRGPGLTKINTTILEDPVLSKQMEEEIGVMMAQADDTWDPHLRLEFLKVCIRSVVSSKVMENRKSTRKDIQECEEELNEIENLKIVILKEQKNLAQKTGNIKSIDTAADRLKHKLSKLRKALNDAMNFTSRAKWFEYGEKSNKFFLNLNKGRQLQKLISSIKCSGKEFFGQAEISENIRNFYQTLYAKNEEIKEDGEEDFYKFCPKLSEKDANYMDEKLTIFDLEKALTTCKESAPGPDGIPYVIYKKFWKSTGHIILAAWNHSLTTGRLTKSHEESVITLLPKDGKDKRDIKNWRPITLSNCDSKIITKALAIKMSKILETIIDPQQTAYVPGRSVADNLRSNFFLKEYCKKANINSALISLDAKKAFDSVDHEYISTTLKAYGFGQAFIRSFQILYKGITARILVNGYTTEPIQILRGVKQGDALSCAIFIICIDPLLRNLNNNKLIKAVKIGRSGIRFKAAAYADDVSVVCKEDQESIQQVFMEYEKLTKRSGLELNADKTEILMLNAMNEKILQIKYMDKIFKIMTVNKLKICGLYYCSNMNEEYECNVKEKITKLSNKIRAWSHRHLTMEGKTLIVKTFGLSQMIYNMQSYKINQEEITNVERIIFKFLWSNSTSQNGVDRIKRSIMKNDYSKGGMCVTDVDCLNRSLKLRQFIRTVKSNHEIAKIQEFITGDEHLRNEYGREAKLDAICESATASLGILTDYNRSEYEKLTSDEYESDRLLINEIASINLATYFKRKKEMFASCMIINLTKAEIHTLGELTQSYEHENDQRLCQTMKIVMTFIPGKWIEIAKCYNEEINSDDGKLKYMKDSTKNWNSVNELTTKELQKMLKLAANKVESLNVKEKTNIDEFEEENIMSFRAMCKNPKLRNIYFRLIHNDFFTHARMKKYKMTMTDKCPRCDNIEDTRHLLWECSHVKNIWKIYNNLVQKLNLPSEVMTNYENVYTPGKTPALCMIKIRIIQELIQIERPKNWTEENIQKICIDLLKIEKYNASITRTIPKFLTKWKSILST
jgi:exonuclease III